MNTISLPAAYPVITSNKPSFKPGQVITNPQTKERILIKKICAPFSTKLFLDKKQTKSSLNLHYFFLKQDHQGNFDDYSRTGYLSEATLLKFKTGEQATI